MKKYLSFDIGLRNLSYIILEFDHDEKKYKIQEWKNVDILENVLKKKKITQCEIIDLVQDYCKNYLLDKAKECDEILLELQPGFAKKMIHNVFTTMYGYFRDNIGKEKVFAVSPKKKLDGQVPPANLTSKQKYTWRKKKSIEMCRNFLSSNSNLNTWIPYFESHKPKLDDLADCILQAKWWIERPPTPLKRKRGRPKKIIDSMSKNTNTPKKQRRAVGAKRKTIK